MLPGYAAQRGRVQLAPDQQHVQKAKPQLVILLNLFERKTKPYQAILNKPIRLRLGEAFLCEIRKSERGVVIPYTSFQGIKRKITLLGTNQSEAWHELCMSKSPNF